MKVAHNCQVKNLDKIYEKYFPAGYKGFFVEVGAFDGYNHSNTWGLAEDGWSGIYYEPIPDFYRQCVERHKNNNVIVVNQAVGNYIGTVTLHLAGPITTASSKQFSSKFWASSYKNTTTITVPITTLNHSLVEYDVKKDFDILVVDVEGLETEVLRGFTIPYWRPKLAIIEVQEYHEAEELRYQAKEINELFDKSGYEKIYVDDINTIYVLKEYAATLS